jgi:hypothetical protein
MGLCSSPSWPADLGAWARKSELGRTLGCRPLGTRPACEVTGLCSNLLRRSAAAPNKQNKWAVLSWVYWGSVFAVF